MTRISSHFTSLGHSCYTYVNIHIHCVNSDPLEVKGRQERSLCIQNEYVSDCLNLVLPYPWPMLYTMFGKPVSLPGNFFNYCIMMLRYDILYCLVLSLNELGGQLDNSCCSNHFMH
jgi:hypothetical protein